MRKNTLFLFARQGFSKAFAGRANKVLMCVLSMLIVYATWNGLSAYTQQTAIRKTYEREVRHNWEKMPDKHPHRMAHYGYLAIRPKHPLSFFDLGMESYTGNIIFLEAHKQNSANFSEAGMSTGLLRFGEISIAMILQVLLPLVLFFIGFSTIAGDRENGTLKILLSQGASWKEIIFGKSIGLLAVAMVFLLPVIALLLVVCMAIGEASADVLSRIGWLMLFFLLYYAIVSLVAVLISGISRTAKLSLVSLIGIWLLFTIITPRTTQAIGGWLHPAPSRIAFESGIEKELIKKGDSHDPDDPYYKALKDSVLRANQVDSVQQLSFNYSGFQMREGERISAEIYNRHLKNLMQIYSQQNRVSAISSFIDPFIALRNISMASSGTDFISYTHFQQQAEDYRYRLAQHMNELQIKLISNDKKASQQISREFWKSLPALDFRPLSHSEVLRQEWISVSALLGWVLGLTLVVLIFSGKFKSV
ncbi:DUF3526 domain-containing protein [Pseudoflavitalea sp. G-6-1-2]|uniref:ABC transporter permease n=1 Tax=Pseudoflavitalea sp. G-6-1-2 TaxID=2728841 RepID=UPI001469B86C|nr:DUF3526 domain-containing protein [Pseudoflavitalea sp. G-6-1-2]NML22181.1 DUF3526 domain-containing protein [Pseudoflavitalea sp. G-6-1-2]